MKYLLLFFIGSVLCSGAAAFQAEKTITVKGSAFEVSTGKKIEINWKGEKLISGDTHSWIANKDVGSFAEKSEVSVGKEWQYTNVWSEKLSLPYRREIGISPDGKKVEVNFQSHQDALMTSYPSPTIYYKIFVPLSALNNSAWEAFTGRSQNAKWSSGTLNTATPDGNFIDASVRWISFTTPRGKITFDFNPQGVTTYFVGGANTIHSQWTVTKKDGMIEMAFAVNATNYGGALTSKLTVFEGDRSDYPKHHAVSYYHYFSEIPAERLFCYGDKSSKAFINAGIKGIDSKER